MPLRYRQIHRSEGPLMGPGLKRADGAPVRHHPGLAALGLKIIA